MHASFASETEDGVDDNQAGPYYFVDTAENKLSGYSPIPIPWPTQWETTATPVQIDLGFISLVDDMGVEYMHELHVGEYPEATLNGNYGKLFKLLISSQMGRNADMCTPVVDQYGNISANSCSGAVSVAYWHRGFVAEMTPTPVWTQVVGDPSRINWNTITPTDSASIFTTSTEYTRAPGDPTFTDTNTPIIVPYRTMTDTAAGQTAGLGYHGHITSTPAGQTDTSIPGVVQESYAPTPTPSYIDTRDTETSGYNQFYTETSSTNWAWQLMIENTPVTDSPAELIPFVSGAGDCQNTSLGTGVSGSVVPGSPYGWGGSSDKYYEPLIGAKIVPVEPNFTYHSPNGTINSFIFCTNGTDFKRLGTGSETIGHTQGEPFSLFNANAGVEGEFAEMKALWPYTFIPNRDDCWDIASNKVYSSNLGGNLGAGWYAETGAYEAPHWGWTAYDVGLSENPFHTANRLEIVKYQMWPTGGGGDSPFDMRGPGGNDYHGGQDHPSVGESIFGNAYQTIHHPRNWKPVPEVQGGMWGTDQYGTAPGGNYHNWHGCLRYGGGIPFAYMDGNIDTGVMLTGRAYSQKSFLDSINNWVASKLGADWRVARANEIIKDYVPPRNSCRMVHTHEEGKDSLVIHTGGLHSFGWDKTATNYESISSAFFEARNFYYEGCGNCSVEVPVLDEQGNVQTTEWQTSGIGDPLFGNTTTEQWYETNAGSLTTYHKATSSGFTEGPEGTQTPTPAGATLARVGTPFRATPVFGEKLTTTADYGTQGTFNPVGVTETLAVVGYEPTPVTAIGTSTYDLIFQTTTGHIPTEVTTRQVKVSVVAGVGNDIGAYVTRRWPDWCVSRRGCEASSVTPLGFFGPTGSLGGACESCNSGAYVNTEMSMCDGDSQSWSYDVGYWGGASQWLCREHGPEKFNYILGLQYQQPNAAVWGGTPPTFVASEETAASLGSLWNMFHHDLVKGAASVEEQGYGCYTNNNRWGGEGEYGGSQIPRLGDINPDYELIDITSWTHNPEAFYRTDKSNYHKSRCCDEGKPTKESWCGIPCFNLKSGNYCYSGEEINVNLGTGTGDFIAVVAGGVYWDDVVQTGASDEEVRGRFGPNMGGPWYGDPNDSYSFGYGLLYPSGNTAGALSGQTDNGDSRYLRYHTKTYTGDLASGDPSGNSGESGHATFIYALKVFEGTQVAGGSGLVTCPGKTGDADCYANSVPFLRDGESSEAENAIWGSGGKTYIKGLISPSGGCPGECETRIGIKICYGKLEGTSYSGFADIETACTKKCESGDFTGWFIDNPSSKRGYTETGEYKIPKNGATVYSGEEGEGAFEINGEGFYYVESGKYIQISPDGEVTGVGDCTSNIGEELEFIANGHLDNWTESGPACAYPSTSTLTASMIFTGNGEEVGITHESCSDFYMPSVGTNVTAAQSSENSLPDGSYYYGVACVQEPTMVGYYAQLNMTDGLGTVVETGKCETAVPFYTVNISYPDWSDVDGVVGWPSSGTLCNLGYCPAVPPSSPHAEFGTYLKVIDVVGYCTGVLTLSSSAKVPVVPDTHGENVIRKTPSTDGEPLFSQPGLPLWYECSTVSTGSTEWGSAIFRASATSFANKSGQCSN